MFSYRPLDGIFMPKAVYSLEHIWDYVSCMHANGKKAVVHMCGHLKALLNEIKETGMDGIHALTEPPVGTCTFEEALDFLGDDLVIIGCLDPCVFLNPNSTSEEIDAAVKKVLTGRVRESNLILGAGADGIPTPLWKYEAVSRAVEKYGVRN
jgi:uroporphyrinogen-III decarboxylase